MVGAFQGRHINQMRHGVELSVRFTSRSYRPARYRRTNVGR
jgi:hypothetical protein